MKFLNATFLSALLVVTSQTTFALDPVSLLLNQPDAPLEILDYSAQYNRGETEIIEHSVTYQNVGDRKIVAVELVLLSFDIWNELFDRSVRTHVKDLDVSEESDLRLPVPVAPSFDGSTFHTGVAYISRVRFENGEIWSVDLSEIALVLDKIAPHISPSSL